MDRHDNASKIDWRTAAALATAAVIVAGLATGGAAARRVRVGGSVRPPTKVVDVRPVYPEEARAAKIQGVVILEAVLGEDGAVIDTKILRSIPELDQAAIDAVSQWKYEPTLLNGEPVELEMTVTINFTLQ